MQGTPADNQDSHSLAMAILVVCKRAHMADGRPPLPVVAIVGLEAPPRKPHFTRNQVVTVPVSAVAPKVEVKDFRVARSLSLETTSI